MEQRKPKTQIESILNPCTAYYKPQSTQELCNTERVFPSSMNSETPFLKSQRTEAPCNQRRNQSLASEAPAFNPQSIQPPYSARPVFESARDYEEPFPNPQCIEEAPSAITSPQLGPNYHAVDFGLHGTQNVPSIDVASQAAPGHQIPICDRELTFYRPIASNTLPAPCGAINRWFNDWRPRPFPQTTANLTVQSRFPETKHRVYVPDMWLREDTKGRRTAEDKRIMNESMWQIRQRLIKIDDKLWDMAEEIARLEKLMEVLGQWRQCKLLSRCTKLASRWTLSLTEIRGSDWRCDQPLTPKECFDLLVKADYLDLGWEMKCGQGWIKTYRVGRITAELRKKTEDRDLLNIERTKLDYLLGQWLEVPDELGWWDECDLGWHWTNKYNIREAGFDDTKVEDTPKWYERSKVASLMKERQEKEKKMEIPRKPKDADVKLVEERSRNLFDREKDHAELCVRLFQMRSMMKSGGWTGYSGKPVKPAPMKRDDSWQFTVARGF